MINFPKLILDDNEDELENFKRIIKCFDKKYLQKIYTEFRDYENIIISYYSITSRDQLNRIKNRLLLIDKLLTETLNG